MPHKKKKPSHPAAKTKGKATPKQKKKDGSGDTIHAKNAKEAGEKLQKTLIDAFKEHLKEQVEKHSVQHFVAPAAKKKEVHTKHTAAHKNDLTDIIEAAQQTKKYQQQHARHIPKAQAEADAVRHIRLFENKAAQPAGQAPAFSDADMQHLHDNLKYNTRWTTNEYAPHVYVPDKGSDKGDKFRAEHPIVAGVLAAAFDFLHGTYHAVYHPAKTFGNLIEGAAQIYGSYGLYGVDPMSQNIRANTNASIDTTITQLQTENEFTNTRTIANWAFNAGFALWSTYKVPEAPPEMPEEMPDNNTPSTTNEPTTTTATSDASVEPILITPNAAIVKDLQASTEKTTNTAGSSGVISGEEYIIKLNIVNRKPSDISTLGEIEAANYLTKLGYNVQFQTPGLQRSRAGGTADLLVSGLPGAGKNSVPFDIYTPTSTNPDNIFSGIAKKTTQTPNLIVNLQHTIVTPEQLGDINSRLINMKDSKPPFERIIIFK